MDHTIGPPSFPHDIHFKCPGCASSLVVDAAAAGLTVSCQRCGNPVLVPDQTLSFAGTPALADLRRRLAENEAQRTEVTGYMNQMSIQLHRWKLRLETLNERKAELEAEINSASP